MNPWAGILSGAGQGVEVLNDYMTSQKRERIIKWILERRQRQQEEMDALVMGEVGNLRGETPEAEREKGLSEFVGQLRAARAAQPVSYGARGAVSDREVADMGELKRGLGQFSNREADITSRIDSQRRMREGQNLRLGRTGTGMRELGHKISASDFLAQLRLAAARKNPWLDMLGEGLKGAGQAMGGGGMGGGGSGMSMNASGYSSMMNGAKGG